MSGADFIMTTSSYKRTGSEKYFVTVLTDNNFVIDPGQIADASEIRVKFEERQDRDYVIDFKYYENPPVNFAIGD